MYRIRALHVILHYALRRNRQKNRANPRGPPACRLHAAAGTYTSSRNADTFMKRSFLRLSEYALSLRAQ
jgi:hypothetical protein